MNEAGFRAALLDPDRPVPPGLVDPQGRPAGRRFDVYRNNVVGSLTEALRQGFPAVRALVGDEFFTAMARVFVRAHPPASKLMMFYGADLAAFLAAFPPVAHLPYLPDVARLEHAIRESYHSADAAPVSGAVLAALGPEGLAASRLVFAPAVRLLRSPWPVATIRAAAVGDGPPPQIWQGEAVLVVRPGFDPEPRLLPGGGGAIVAALMAGATPAEAATAAPGDLAAVFAILLSSGSVTDIRGKDPA